MNITPIPGEPTRYYVTGSRLGEPHLIDLDHDGHAWCSCHDHQFRRLPLIERGEKCDPCKHVQAVKDLLAKLDAETKT